uniref:hypothetical protein n=1 Tax=Eubacterium sp. TaxID=142586 RepID=UPI00402525FA
MAAKSVADNTKKEQLDRMNEKVTIKLFKDNGKYKDDLTVTVNGITYQIQRGKTVEVPRYIADVIAQSERQDTQTANMLEKLVNDFNEKTKKL